MGKTLSIGNHCNPVEIIHSAHANDYGVLIVGGGTARQLGLYHMGHGSLENNDDVITLLKKMADRIGFHLEKKPTPKSE